MTENARQQIIVRFVWGESYAQIADALNIRVDTIKKDRQRHPHLWETLTQKFQDDLIQRYRASIERCRCQQSLGNYTAALAKEEIHYSTQLAKLLNQRDNKKKLDKAEPC